MTIVVNPVIWLVDSTEFNIDRFHPAGIRFNPLTPANLLFLMGAAEIIEHLVRKIAFRLS